MICSCISGRFIILLRVSLILESRQLIVGGSKLRLQLRNLHVRCGELRPESRDLRHFLHESPVCSVFMIRVFTATVKTQGQRTTHDTPPQSATSGSVGPSPNPI